VRNTRPDHYNGLRLDADGRVLAFVPKGHTEETWHFVGVQVVEPQVFEGIALGAAAETVAGVYRDLVRDQPGAVRAWRVDATFLDVGTPSDYIEASLHMAAQEGQRGDVILEAPWTPDARRAVVDPTAQLTRCVVWPDATIGAGAVLDRCVVLSGVSVPAGRQAVGQVLD